MNESESNEGYTYTRKNGTVEHAETLEIAHKLCPILGQMSLEQAGVMLKMGARGRAVKEQQEVEALGTNETNSTELDDPYSFENIFNTIEGTSDNTEPDNETDIGSASITSVTYEAETETSTDIETEPVATTIEAEKSVEPSAVEAKAEVRTETSETDKPEVSETKSYIQSWTYEAKVKPEREVKADAKADIKKVYEPSLNSIDELPVAAEKIETMSEPVVEIAADNTEAEIEKPIMLTKSIVEVPAVKDEVQAEVVDEMEITVPVAVETLTEKNVVTEAIVEVVDNVKDTENESVEPIKAMAVPSEEIESPYEAVANVTQEIIEQTPFEKIDFTPIEEKVTIAQIEMPKDITETNEIISEITHAIEDEITPEVIAPYVTPIVQEIQPFVELEELSVPEPTTQVTPVVDSTPKIEIQDKTDNEAEAVATIAELEEDEKTQLFEKVIETAEIVTEEEEEELVQASFVSTGSSNGIITSKSKARRIMGMFATLLHVKYTPI